MTNEPISFHSQHVLNTHSHDTPRWDITRCLSYTPRSSLSALRSPLSALRSLLPALRFPLSTTAEYLRHKHMGLVIALLVYLILAFSYFFIVPIFEGPDEWTHTGHVKYIASGKGLPVMLPGQGIWGGQQPPLYFALGALLVQPFELDGVAEYEETRRNPHTAIGYALDPGNKNNYLHQPAERFPYHGLSLTVHVLRLYSMTFGLIALIFIYFTAFDLISNINAARDLQQPATLPQATPNPIHSPLPAPRSSLSALRSPLLASRSPLPASQFATAVALFVACQPMFAFITASVANEPANIAFSAIGLWLAQRYVLYGPSQHWARAAALGMTLGLISLSKMTGLSFGLVAVVAILITAISTRKQPGAARLLWRDGIIIAGLFLAVGGWWYWRNYRLYGDFFQLGLYKIYFNVDPQPLTLSDFLYTLSTGEVSFWATFGWLNIVAPDWVYSIYRIISRVGFVGAALAVIIHAGLRIRARWLANNRQRPATPIHADTNNQQPEPPQAQTAENNPKTSSKQTNQSQSSNNPLPALRSPLSALRSPLPAPRSPLPALLLHLIFPLTLAFSLTRLVAIEGGIQGRQLLPALGSIAIVVMWGWWMLAPTRLRGPVIMALLAILFALAVWLPYGVVAPEFIPKPLLTEADVPADLPRLNWIYKDEMKLIGAKIGAEVIRPGERVPVTAYWQALKPMETNYSVFVHLMGRDRASVGQINTYPGLGLRPTRSLEPGQIVKDTYQVQVNGGSEAPTRLLVNMGLFDFNEPGRPGIEPAMFDSPGPASPTIGQLKLVPQMWPAYDGTPPIAEFDDHIWLLDSSIHNCQTPGDNCQIRFKWLARGRPSADYTVFIQLWHGDEFIGFDAPPLGNDYPTSMWAAGEIIDDPHQLDLTSVPAGDYRVLAGLYNFATGERLPATAAGAPLLDNALDLGTISINASVSNIE